MSFHVTALVMRAKFGNPHRKCIALKLADCANDDGTKIFPAVETIADHAEVSKRAVQRALVEWKEAGVLQLIKQGGGRKKSSEYAFNLTVLEKIADGALIFTADPASGSEKKWRLVEGGKCKE